jgi:hypothetical protein
LAVDYAPPQYPQDKGKIERVCRTARSAMPRAQGPAMATGLPAIGRAASPHARLQSRVTEAAGHAQVPALRLPWKPRAARPWPPASRGDDVLPVPRPLPGPQTRQGHAARGRSSRPQSAPVPARPQGEVREVKAGKAPMDVASLGNGVQSLRQPCRHHTATTRQVHTGGLGPCTQPRMQLDLPQGTDVVGLREGQDSLFALSDQVVCRLTGQEKCHPCI